MPDDNKPRTVRIGNEELPEGAAGQMKRVLFNRETGERIEVYNVDAREYLKQGNWVTSKRLVTGKTGSSTLLAKARAQKPTAPTLKPPPSDDDDFEDEQDGTQLEESEGKPVDRGPEPATWQDWTTQQLLSKAHSMLIENADDMGREELVESLVNFGVVPSDDKPQVEEDVVTETDVVVVEDNEETPAKPTKAKGKKAKGRGKK